MNQQDKEQGESMLTNIETRKMNKLLEEFDDVFHELQAGSAKVEHMVVTFKEGWSHPPMEPPRRYSPRVEAAIDMDINKQSSTGVIEVSKATYGLNVHVVPKADSESGFCFTIDFRPLNSGVVINPYPLPHIAIILHSMAGSHYWISSRVTGNSR